MPSPPRILPRQLASFPWAHLTYKNGVATPRLQLLTGRMPTVGDRVSLKNGPRDPSNGIQRARAASMATELGAEDTLGEKIGQD